MITTILLVHLNYNSAVTADLANQSWIVCVNLLATYTCSIWAKSKENQIFIPQQDSVEIEEEVPPKRGEERPDINLNQDQQNAMPEKDCGHVGGKHSTASGSIGNGQFFSY